MRSGRVTMTKAAAAAAPPTPPRYSKINSKLFIHKKIFPHRNLSLSSHRPINPSSPSPFPTLFCCSQSPNNSPSISHITTEEILIPEEENQWRSEGVSVPPPPQTMPSIAKLSFTDKAFFLFAFFACTTSVAFASLVIAAVPTLHAMRRVAISFSKLADTAREELPSTMAAIRLSGMEISDLTLELSDLSQDIAEGVNKSAQAVQAAKAGIRQIGSRAREQTMSMIEERANLPNISLKPVVGAAKKTSHAVGQATETFISMISRVEDNSEDDNSNAIERLEI